MPNGGAVSGFACGSASVRHISAPGASEGYFGRLKVEFFHGCDWSGVTIEQFMDMLDAYLRWYRDARVKSDLGHEGPMAYRMELGLVA